MMRNISEPKCSIETCGNSAFNTSNVLNDVYARENPNSSKLSRQTSARGTVAKVQIIISQKTDQTVFHIIGCIISKLKLAQFKVKEPAKISSLRLITRDALLMPPLVK